MSTARIDEIFKAHMSTVAASCHLAPEIALAANATADAIRRGRKILACGNGGSAADAQHFACELVGRFLKDRPGIPAIALTTDPSVMTSVSNDYGFEHVFSRQVEALGVEGDVLLAFSTSGNSPNVVSAARSARERGMTVISFTGQSSGKLAEHAQVALRVPSSVTPRIQEIHELMVHILCELVEEELS